MPKIKIVGNDKEILYSNGETLLEILLREGFSIYTGIFLTFMLKSNLGVYPAVRTLCAPSF